MPLIHQSRSIRRSHERERPTPVWKTRFQLHLLLPRR